MEKISLARPVSTHPKARFMIRCRGGGLFFLKICHSKALNKNTFSFHGFSLKCVSFNTNSIAHPNIGENSICKF